MIGHGNVGKLMEWAHASLVAEQHGEHSGGIETDKPFITISRQAGARGNSLAALLAEKLNAIDPGDTPWTIWDRELVNRVCAEFDLSPRLIESIEGPPRNWFTDLLSNFSDLSHGEYLGNAEIFRRIAAAIRTIAKKGRAIIVGRGGAYATADMPLGVHIRLVAPLDNRIAYIAQELKMSPETAAAEIHRRDEERNAFHKRCSGGKGAIPENFTLTINAAKLTDEEMATCILPLVKVGQPAHAR